MNKTALKKETLYGWRTGFRHEPCGLEPMAANFKDGEKSNKSFIKHFFWVFLNCIVSCVHAVRTGYHTCITLIVQRIEYVLTSTVLIQVAALTTACCVSLCGVIVAVLPCYWGSE